MKRLLMGLPGNEKMTEDLSRELGVAIGKISFRAFPDGETYLKFESSVQDHEVILVCTLDEPNPKVLPLLFAAETARDLGAAHVGLVAPYLAYMRQDKRFHDGEGITSTYFADLFSRHFDWLVTVDPHLHRRHSLSEIYSVPATVVPSAPLIADWIGKHVSQPVLVGPDSESRQWVASIAEEIKAPFCILEKKRLGDRDVVIGVPEMGKWAGKVPVLADDIISTGRTLMEAVRELGRQGFAPSICVGVHAIFAESSYDQLLSSGPTQVVTVDTIPHPSNGIYSAGALAKAVRAFR